MSSSFSTVQSDGHSLSHFPAEFDSIRLHTTVNRGNAKRQSNDGFVCYVWFCKVCCLCVKNVLFLTRINTILATSQSGNRIIVSAQRKTRRRRLLSPNWFSTDVSSSVAQTASKFRNRAETSTVLVKTSDVTGLTSASCLCGPLANPPRVDHYRATVPSVLLQVSYLDSRRPRCVALAGRRRRFSGRSGARRSP